MINNKSTGINRKEGFKSKDERVLAVLNNSALSVAGKVDKLLELQQESKIFKDVGERVPGSRKELAAIRMIRKH